MPREKQVNSLQDLCLSKIRRTLEDVWWPCCHADLLVGDLSIFVGEAFQVANESDEVQPFQFLPGQLVEAIFVSLPWRWESVKKKECLLKKFLLPQLENLELVEDFLQPGLSTASRRGLSLKKLKLVANYTSVREVLTSFLPHPTFSNLQKLDVHGTDINDNVLYCLGAYCKKLQELDLGDCCNISDEGVEKLCGAASCENSDNSQNRGGCCKLLVQLKIKGTRISVKGVIMALEKLPHLQVLEYAWSGSDLAKFQSSYSEDTKFNLKNLDCDFVGGSSPSSNIASSYVKGSLAAFTSRCPSLVQVHIVFLEGEMEDEDLVPLQMTENLSDLNIELCSRWPDAPPVQLRRVSFARGILPLLRQVGGGLRTLKLRGFNEIDISVIAKYCPGLQTLHLSQNMCYTRTDLAQPPFWNLEVMRLNCELTSSIENGDLLFLLSSPSLTEISISCCPCMDDSVFQAMAGLPRLESLDLCNCSEISHRKIDFLMTSRNSLGLLRIRSDGDLIGINEIALEEEVLNHNWDLKIEIRELAWDSSDELEYDSWFDMSDDSDSHYFHTDSEYSDEEEIALALALTLASAL